MEIPDEIRLSCHFVDTVSILCGESQSVLDGGFRARGEVDILDTVSGVAIAGDGDALFDNVRWSLLKVAAKSLSQIFPKEISA